MRGGGTGGPLLCIGDLLSDVGEVEDVSAPPDLHQQQQQQQSSSAPVSIDIHHHHPLNLTNLFQKNYDQLNEALAGTDHSWTALTLKLCTALETANKLVQSTNSNATLLSEKVGELEKVVKRGDSAVSATQVAHISLNVKEGTLRNNQDIK